MSDKEEWRDAMKKKINKREKKKVRDMRRFKMINEKILKFESEKCKYFGFLQNIILFMIFYSNLFIYLFLPIF